MSASRCSPIALHRQVAGEVILENAAMKKLATVGITQGCIPKVNRPERIRLEFTRKFRSDMPKFRLTDKPLTIVVFRRIIPPSRFGDPSSLR